MGTELQRDEISSHRAASSSPVVGSAQAVLEKAGYDTLEDLQEEIDDQREAYSISSGAAKDHEKKELDELLAVLADYEAALKTSTNASSSNKKSLNESARHNPRVVAVSENLQAVLDEAGYENLEELREEIQEQQEAYENAKGQKKVRAKEDLDEMVDVLSKYEAALKSSIVVTAPDEESKELCNDRLTGDDVRDGKHSDLQDLNATVSPNVSPEVRFKRILTTKPNSCSPLGQSRRV